MNHLGYDHYFFNYRNPQIKLRKIYTKKSGQCLSFYGGWERGATVSLHLVYIPSVLPSRDVVTAKSNFLIVGAQHMECCHLIGA